MQKDTQTISVLKDARDDVVPSRERFNTMFSSLMAGHTPEKAPRLPKASPFMHISGLLNSNIRDLRITAVRTTKGITLVFDYALVKTPKQISRLATKAWKVCVERLG